MHVIMMIVLLYFVQTAGSDPNPERHLLQFDSMEECTNNLPGALTEAAKIKDVVAVGLSCSDTPVNRII